MAVTIEDYIRLLEKAGYDTTNQEEVEKGWRKLCRANELSVEWGLHDLQCAFEKDRFLQFLRELRFDEDDIAEIENIWDDEPRRERLIRDTARERFLKSMRARDQEQLALALLENPLLFEDGSWHDDDKK